MAFSNLLQTVAHLNQVVFTKLLTTADIEFEHEEKKQEKN